MFTYATHSGRRCEKKAWISISKKSGIGGGKPYPAQAMTAGSWMLSRRPGSAISMVDIKSTKCPACGGPVVDTSDEVKTGWECRRCLTRGYMNRRSTRFAGLEE